MLFISRERSPTYVMVHGTEEFSGGMRVRSKKPATLQFNPLEKPFFVGQLPIKDGIGRGMLDTKLAASQLKKDGYSFKGEDGQDNTEFVITDFLFDRPDYGVNFVAVGTKTGEEILPQNRYIIEQADESEFTHYCRLCKQSFKSLAGAEGHCGSSKHQDALQAAEQESWRALTN